MTTITVVTPWLDCRELIPAYLAAIQAGQPDATIVYDTGSDPQLNEGELHGCTVSDAEGYVDACNQGLLDADTDAVLWLNNDVVHTTVNWLEPIRQSLQPGRLVGAQLRTDTHADVDGRPHAYLDGWCIAGMVDDLVSLGGLDENLIEPAYYADNILCLRAKAAGMKLVQVGVGLHHLSNYTSKQDPARRDLASSANRERYLAEARELHKVTA